MSSFTEHGTLKEVDYEKLLERVSTESESWIPEPGDTLVGTIVEISSNDAGYGIYPILVIETQDGKQRAFHAMQTMAKSTVAEARPEPGDHFACKYFGKGQTRAGNAFHKYRILIDKPEGTSNSVDWDEMGAQATQEVGQLGITEEDHAPTPAAKKKGTKTNADQGDEIPF